MITRRQLLGAAASIVGAASATARSASAQPGHRMPVAFVSHGGPMIAVDPVRGPALRAWGARIPKPRGVLAMTPHWGSRRLALGSTGRGIARYDFPRWLASKLPADLSYPSPPSEELAARVEALLRGVIPIERAQRDGLDHTTWMPLLHLFPAADVPVLEIAYPYVPEAEAFALGRRLSPLRDEGVLVLASGGMTHNLASIDLDAPPPTGIPAWSREFDAWATERLSAGDVGALLDWRRRAPAPDLAHPDDGGHFRVLLFALGAASAAPVSATFPIADFELGLSMRCVDFW
jgi:4,5-DOPA dioxygenase extradiol